MIDFGLSRPTFEEKLSTIVGTPYYVAPEIIGGSYDIRCDYWSLGVMMYMMLCGKPPFYSKNNKKIFALIKKGKYDFTPEAFKTVSPEVLDVIKGFLTLNVNKRLGARDALDHPLFQQSNVELITTGKSYITADLFQRLKSFRTTNIFQREIIRLMVKIFDYSEEVKRLRYIFFCVDYLNNGSISEKELYAFFKENDEQVDQKIIKEVAESLELREKGSISYSEFMAGAMDRKFYTNPSNLKIMFRRLDIDDTKQITAANIKNCFARFGFILKESEADEMLSTFDNKINGIITQEEFFEKMMEISGNS